MVWVNTSECQLWDSLHLLLPKKAPAWINPVLAWKNLRYWLWQCCTGQAALGVKCSYAEISWQSLLSPKRYLPGIKLSGFKWMEKKEPHELLGRVSSLLVTFVDGTVTEQQIRIFCSVSLKLLRNIKLIWNRREKRVLFWILLDHKADLVRLYGPQSHWSGGLCLAVHRAAAVTDLRRGAGLDPVVGDHVEWLVGIDAKRCGMLACTVGAKRVTPFVLTCRVWSSVLSHLYKIQWSQTQEKDPFTLVM